MCISKITIVVCIHKKDCGIETYVVDYTRLGDG